MADVPTERTRIRRAKDKARHDREIVNEIFDEALICHVGFIDDGSPFVIPTIHARVGDVLYFHGSPASRMLRLMKNGAEITITATLLDGIVAARSVFHHSMHYRSAMIFGTARIVDAREERTIALEAISNAALPGRWDEARLPSRNEDKGTLVVAVAIEEYSAKVSDKDVGDEDDDYDLPIWAGVIPLSIVAGSPVPDHRLLDGVELPDSVKQFVAAFGGVVGSP
jgi:nitroimidazol reductase NimA-like FMN-containing flavoprotein (pyridoxamine 5'-phosphate oxidase superfamily)